ncbi:shikimate dehydrogenase [Massilia psychrophila]|uniref:Shikimate dehydrogenase (NADP(+)) n=1 Tax=Massilia psychrophila TaxID=1603353 RepID=A0A2G8T6T8_9BURK|nr:shikimate dehydrogenase [Massilia psychrophila]PIL41765.1 shikimate dehydrogenase [Massilia psychrophila]GGE60385.1 shikimate dehydrogenase (NADP(+)) [Massilia psychrophila]
MTVTVGVNARYCVIGNPVAHSKSPTIHAAFALQTGQGIVYERCLAPVDGFAAIVRQLVASGYSGANVTVPFKLEAAALATTLSERARAAGAVNTLSFTPSGIAGDNTDGAGLVGDILHNAGVAIAGRRVLLVGAGGAARGAILPLLQQGPRQLVIANRTAATAENLAASFNSHGVPVEACTFADLDGRFDIVVNATSASLAGDLPPLPPAVFGAGTLALDMMYAADPTPFMRFAAAHGASMRDGLGMLVEQAAEAFFVWRGVRPQTCALLAAMRPPA